MKRVIMVEVDGDPVRFSTKHIERCLRMAAGLMDATAVVQVTEVAKHERGKICLPIAAGNNTITLHEGLITTVEHTVEGTNIDVRPKMTEIKQGWSSITSRLGDILGDESNFELKEFPGLRRQGAHR